MMILKVKIVFITSLFLLVFSNFCTAAENFDDWNISTEGDTTIIPSGTTLHMSATNSIGEAYGECSKSYPNSKGMIATVNVTEVSGSDVRVGIEKIIGKTQIGTNIQIKISVRYFNNEYSIYYTVREKDNNDETLSVYTEGFLGGSDDGWSLEEDVIIGFKRIHNTILLYTPGNGAFLTVRPFEPMNSGESDLVISIFVEDEGVPGRASATVKDVGILHRGPRFPVRPGQ